MISAQHIEKKYQQVKALQDVSFEIGEGEIFGFIGPDGAGKSTLFRILTTLLLADRGQATMYGLDVVKDFKKVRLITGYMPGQFSLYPDLSVEENLQFFATVFGTSIRENYNLIKDVYQQIEPFKDRLAGRLSGGMKQKLALSCALIHQPRILVLDEPTTGVDAVSRHEFWQLLKGLKEKGITILVSTPYMDEAQLCDRVALIQKGQLLRIDSPEAIERSFGEKLYAVSTHNMRILLKDLRRFEQTKSIFPFGQYMHYTDKNGFLEQNKLIDFLKQEGHNEIQINEIDPGIEDVFMKLIAEEVTHVRV